MAWHRRLFDWVRWLVRDRGFPSRDELPWGQLVLLYMVRGTIQVARESTWDRLPRQAAALAFQTIFSTVPLLVIALTVATTFISGKEVSEITDWLSNLMLPAQALAIAPEVQRVAMAVDVHALGVAGGLGLVIIACTLFVSLSNIVDDIWRVSRKRSLWYQLLGAGIFLILLPTFIGLSMYVSRLLSHLPASLDFFVPLAINVAGLFLTFRHVPSTSVSRWAALLAAVVSGIVIELGKIGFGIYVARLAMTIHGLYGAIGFVPLALFWIYLMWFFFLLGVEMSFTWQNLPCLWMRDAGKRDAELRATAGGTLALIVAHQVYRSGGATSAELARRLEASPPAVSFVIECLTAAGFVMTDKTDIVSPACPAREIQVFELLDLLWENRPPKDEDPGLGQLSAVLDRIQVRRREDLDGMTLADLL